MTQEEKQLLLKDLCARLPYGLKVKHEAQDFPSTLEWVDVYRMSAGRKADKLGVGSDWGSIEFFKPYLRPMSSMTEEEEDEFISLNAIPSPCQLPNHTNMNWYSNATMLDWLNAHHFDYRGLIEKGLALEALEDMYEKGGSK